MLGRLLASFVRAACWLSGTRVKLDVMGSRLSGKPRRAQWPGADPKLRLVRRAAVVP